MASTARAARDDPHCMADREFAAQYSEKCTSEKRFQIKPLKQQVALAGPLAFSRFCFCGACKALCARPLAVVVGHESDDEEW